MSEKPLPADATERIQAMPEYQLLVNVLGGMTNAEAVEAMAKIDEILPPPSIDEARSQT